MKKSWTIQIVALVNGKPDPSKPAAGISNPPMFWNRGGAQRACDELNNRATRSASSKASFAWIPKKVL